MKIKIIYVRLSVVLFLLFCIALTACEAPKRKAESILDTPEHHTFSGIKLILKEDYDDALREFLLALQLDPKYPLAYAGIGLAYGYKKDFMKAFSNMEKAKSLAKTKEQKTETNAGMIRLYTMERKEGWIYNCEKEFKFAVKTDANAPSPYYYMGIAYKSSQTMEGIGKAGEMFKKVIEINKYMLLEANKELELVQKIQRAEPETR